MAAVGGLICAAVETDATAGYDDGRTIAPAMRPSANIAPATTSNPPERESANTANDRE